MPVEVKLRPHQKTAVEKLSNGKILFGGVGTGKSLTAAAYYMAKEAPRDVYVITTALKRDSLDWEREFIQYNVYKTPETTVAGVLRVDSWNNIKKYSKIHGAFFIFDEQRLVGSGAWVKAFLKIANRNHWIILSATPGDTWLDYAAVFVANGFYENRSKFIEEHVVYNPYTKFPKVDHYVGLGKLQKYQLSLLVEMPYELHTKRHSVTVPVDHDAELLEKVFKKRWNPFRDLPIRNVAELFGVARKVVYSDPSRILAVKNLMKMHPRLIVFYNFNYELWALRELSKESDVRVWNAKTDGKKPNDNSVYVGRPSKWGNPFTIGKDGTREEVLQKFRDYMESSPELMNDIHELHGKDLVCWCSPLECHADILMELANQNDFVIAEWNGHKHEEVPTTKRWVYLVQYTAGSEGWNCTTTDTTVFYSLNYSYKKSKQAHGRIDRLNTPFVNLFYYTLMSDSVVDKAVKEALDEKRDFNEGEFIGQWAGKK